MFFPPIESAYPECKKAINENVIPAAGSALRPSPEQYGWPNAFITHRTTSLRTVLNIHSSHSVAYARCVLQLYFITWPEASRRNGICLRPEPVLEHDEAEQDFVIVILPCEM